MQLHHEGAILQKGFETFEAVSLKERTEQGAGFLTLSGALEVSFYAPGIIRLKWLADQAQADYGLLVSEPQPVPVALSETPGGYRLQSGDVTLEILNGPMRIRFWHGDKKLLRIGHRSHD